MLYFLSLILHLIERATGAPLDTCSSAKNSNQKTPRGEPVREEIVAATTAGKQQSIQNGKLHVYALGIGYFYFETEG